MGTLELDEAVIKTLRVHGSRIHNRIGHRKEVYFATTNEAKFREAEAILSIHELDLKWLNLKGIEVQSNRLEDIALTCARDLGDRMKLPILVEDAGLFIKALNGFPGPYSSYIYGTIGLEGVLKLMQGIKHREAEFKSAVAFCDGYGTEICFTGIAEGIVAERPIGTRGFGFDPIFMPIEAGGKTFAEMTLEEKNSCSHRASALRKFIDWFGRGYSGPPRTGASIP